MFHWPSSCWMALALSRLSVQLTLTQPRTKALSLPVSGPIITATAFSHSALAFSSFFISVFFLTCEVNHSSVVVTDDEDNVVTKAGEFSFQLSALLVEPEASPKFFKPLLPPLASERMCVLLPRYNLKFSPGCWVHFSESKCPHQKSSPEFFICLRWQCFL